MSRKRTYLLTPYYQIKSNITLGTCGRYPKRNYTSYSLFALRTRLEPLARQRLKTPVLIHFDQEYLDQRLKVTVVFFTSGRPISLSPHHQKYLQAALDYITGHHPELTLLMSSGSKWVVDDITLSHSQQTIIPKWWVNDMSRFLMMGSRLRLHYRCKKEYQIAGIYIDLSQFDSHTSSFKDIYMNSISQLNSMYALGYMSLPRGFDSDRLEKWGIKSLKIVPDIDSLKRTIFYPDWKDERLTNPVGGFVPFVNKHVVHKSNHVLLEIGENLLIRHKVAITFRRFIGTDKYIFRGKFVQVEVTNLIEAQTAASLVSAAKMTPIGKLITFQFSSRGRLNIYLMVLNNLTKQDKKKIGLVGLKVQGYQNDDPRIPYCLSCQIPYSANSYYYQGLIRNWVRNETTQANKLKLPSSKFPPPKFPPPKFLSVGKEVEETKIKLIESVDGKYITKIGQFLGEIPSKMRLPKIIIPSSPDSRNVISPKYGQTFSPVVPANKYPKIMILSPTSPQSFNPISPYQIPPTNGKLEPISIVI
uniref:Uncharacterized protein n=1 Tax=Pithovirus LCPAC202 TaxID=2506592 RepID=A0A481Z6A3_9VIRU|nr:MAG: hypothetical protein LCPAC202_00590 [Pithovirus LCPAC202]